MRDQNWFYLGCLILTASLFTGLETLELRAEEPRRAVVAMEMVLSGNYIEPQLYGQPYFNKPPLFNWIISLSFLIFGSFREAAVRLPGLVSLILLAFLHYKLVKKELGHTVAGLAALFFLASVDLLFYGSVNSGEIDLFLSLLVYGQLVSIYLGVQSNRPWLLFLGAYFFMALGILTKGLPALVLQAITLPVYLWYSDRWKWLFGWKHLAGLLVAFLILAAYGWLYHQAGGDIWTFAAQQLSEAEQKSATGEKAGRFISHVLTFPLNLIYWTLPGALAWWLFRKKKLREYAWSHPVLVFTAIVLLVNLPLYWISPGAVARYIYPFFPFLTLIPAWLFFEAQPARALRIACIAGLVLGGLRLVYNAAVMPMQQQQWPSGLVYRQLSEDILKITGDEPVYLTGPPEPMQVSLPLGLAKTNFEYPPQVPYQLPYYLTKSNGHILKYDPKPAPGKFYLTFPSFVDTNVFKVHYRFVERWQGRDMVLVKEFIE